MKTPKTTIKVDKETLQQFRSTKPDGMTHALFLRRLLGDRQDSVDRIKRLEERLQEIEATK